MFFSKFRKERAEQLRLRERNRLEEIEDKEEYERQYRESFRRDLEEKIERSKLEKNTN